jgi:glycosyltransferase involved in cell wall biosynthesis
MPLSSRRFIKIAADEETISQVSHDQLIRSREIFERPMPNSPISARKISIITPSLNRVKMLKAAVQSVVAQRYPNYEHIIIDGSSTDGTLEYIKTQPQIKFICEPDRGMYDALNKGLALASGDVVGFLNTDDLYAEGIFNAVMEIFGDPNILAVAGKADVFFEGAGNQAGIKLHYSPEEQTLLESTIRGNYFNAWFFRIKVFDLVGAFNPAYKIAGDRDFMLRIALKRIHFRTIDKLVYLYRSHAGSLTFDHSNDKQELSARELLEMSKYYLEYQNLTPADRRLIVQLHTQESLALARWQERSGNMVGYISTIADCLRYDPLSMPRVLRHLLRSMCNQGDRMMRHVIEKRAAKS